jgi:hypothetical protein
MACPCSKAARRRYPNNPAIEHVLAQPLSPKDYAGFKRHRALEEATLFHLLPAEDLVLLRRQHEFIDAAYRRGDLATVETALKQHELDEAAAYERYINGR